VIRRLQPSSGEDGFTIVELMAALSVLAIGFFSLAGALGLAFKTVALARQRQTATEVASARIEHLRNIPYDAVALSAALVHDPNPDKPDYYVSADGSRYDVSGAGAFEDLVVDAATGQVLHLEDPVQVGATTMEVWQYVTWFDRPKGIKRLTVVVVYKPLAAPGRPRTVRASSFFTRGTVTLGGTGATPAPASTASPTPTPSPTPTGPCAGDTAAPTGSFDIVSHTGQTGYTASTTVSLRMSFTDPCAPIRARFSNDNVTFGPDVTYDATNPTVAWTLTAGDGTKTVYGTVRDGVGNQRTLDSRTVVLDTQKPSVPGTLVRTVSCSGSDRTVRLDWGTSTDPHFVGYRVYVSTNSGPWTVLVTTSSLTYTTTHKKSLDSVRYYVVGYDRAGNESDATNTVSLAKNQCS
jgi:prepilin-type N-terminal cleavage/methylation domain-containing protein